MVTLPLEEGMTCDVIGDVHGSHLRFYALGDASHDFVFILGQFYDMLHLYSLTGEPSDKHCLLMNGDLVDRGSWSMEVILTALAYKCKFCCRVIIIYDTDRWLKGCTLNECSSTAATMKHER